MVFARASGPLLELVPDGVRMVDLNAPTVATSAPALVRYLRRSRPATLISSIANANVVGVAAAAVARPRPRTVVIEHTTLSLISPNASKLRHRLVPSATRVAYPRADSIVAVSDGVADDLARYCSVARSEIQVIPNPVVSDELRGRASAPLDHEWFADGQPPVILGVGSLNRLKDYGNMISAFARLRRWRPARLLILGEGHERHRLEQLIVRLGLGRDVLLHGFERNPYPYIAQAALLALSSVCEGLPTVLIESLALGTRMVSTDCQNGPREILDGGRYGALVAPGDSGALANAMRESLDRPRPSVPAATLERYSVASAVDSYERLLSSAA